MEKVGVVFSNLGTPDSTSPKDVARYLREFLMDPHVITIPWPIRFLLVNGIIAPFRSKKSAKAYEKIWTPEGSPLRTWTLKTAKDLQASLGEKYKVSVAMRYGQPSYEQAKEELKDCEKVILFQQYPQFADSTTTTGEEHFNKVFDGIKTEIISPYYDHQAFNEAYVSFLKKELETVEYDHLLMSFHGLPEDHLRKADPSKSHCLKVSNCCEKAQGDVLDKCYRAQCMASAKNLAQGLDLTTESYSVSFQSRLGRQKWIEPYTEDMYGELVRRGVKKLAVICPGFSVDGLETLEEIAMEGKHTFLEQGGEEFHYLPCLNNDPGWVAACAAIIQRA
ncbi:MAG: ferrochelatase [Bdellovibrionales bacterium]|nr:ferrochelatase [Bdellovibrionales bacterium]